MNLLAHLWLAERSGTSFAGQILGDIVKGAIDADLSADLRAGIRLHRAIDSFSDAHSAHRAMRACFEPPLRRYAGILVDIGFDHSLARGWSRYSSRPLTRFARIAEQQVRSGWPGDGYGNSARMRGLAQILAGYRGRSGIQRALDSVSRRLRRANPVADALDTLMALSSEFDALLPVLIADLEQHVRRRVSA